MLELVDRTNLSFVDLYHKGSSPFSGRSIYLPLKVFFLIELHKLRDLSLVVKCETFNLCYTGSNPVDLNEYKRHISLVIILKNS